MASYDINKVNLSLLKQYKTFFDNENSYYDTASYNTFLSCYLNNCSDPFIQNMSTILKRDYEQIKKGYNSINNWWSSYNSGIEALEEKLATCIFQSIIDETINNLDSLSLMEYSRFYDGLLSAYNDIFINNIGVTDFSLEKLQALGEENIVVKNFIALYPHISEIDPIEARNIINSLMDGNVTDEQIVSNVSNIISTLAETGEIEKIRNLITATQSKDTVIIFNFRDLIKNNPEYKDQLETIYKDYKEYQSSKYQEMINEIVLKEDMDAYSKYRNLTSYMAFNYNAVMDYLIKHDNAKKAFEMLGRLGVDAESDGINFDDALKSFASNYTSQEMIDLFTSSKANDDVIFINIKKILEMTKGRDNYNLLKGILDDYYNYQKEIYKEQILKKLYLDSRNSVFSVIDDITILKKRAGIELDIDYAKEAANIFLNGQEEKALTFVSLIKYNVENFNMVEFLNSLIKEKDSSVLIKILDFSRGSRNGVLTGNEMEDYLDSIKLQDQDFYSRVKDLFNNYCSSYMKENSDPRAYAFFIKTLKDSSNPLLNYLCENLYLLCGDMPFTLVADKPTRLSPGKEEMQISYYSCSNNIINFTSQVMDAEAFRTPIHELGHCLFYVATKGDFPMDYINNPSLYTDRLLINEEGTYMLNEDATSYITHLHNMVKENRKEFELQYDDGSAYYSTNKKVTEMVNSMDLSEVYLILDEVIGSIKEGLVEEIRGLGEEEINEMSIEDINLLKASLTKEEIIAFITEYECGVAKMEAYNSYDLNSNRNVIVPSASDLVASFLKGKVYRDKMSGQVINYYGAHSESYYNSSPYAFFNEQFANFFVLKIIHADDEIEKIRKLLGDDWYNMMEDTYNKSISKLGGE